MTFEARTRDELAREYLARLGARYEREGERLDARVGSPAWLRAQALAVIFEALDLQAAGAGDHILPDRATGLHLAAHAELAEVRRTSGMRDEDLRAGVLSWWQESMAPMGPDDWIALLESHPTVASAFVYPGVNPDVATDYDAPGTTMLCVLGPAQGDSTTQTDPDLDDLRAWLNGTQDASGAALQGPELRPVCAHPDSVRLVAVSRSTLALAVSIENDAAHPFPWAGSLTVVSLSANSIVVSGDHTDKAGLPMLVRAQVGSVVTPVRGEYLRVVPSSASYDGGTARTTFTLPSNVFQAPFTPSGDPVIPCPPNWNAIRLAVFALVDGLGPGDISPSRRYPPPTASMTATLYPSALRAAILGAEGVLNATTALAVASTPSAGQRIDLSYLRVLAL